MSDFRDNMTRFINKAKRVTNDTFVNSVALGFESITEGSPLTGAPGQPVQTGNLKDSWKEDFIDVGRAEIHTNVAYAPYIEAGGVDGRQYVLRSEVGGFHSVSLTRAGWDQIVAHAHVQAESANG